MKKTLVELFDKCNDAEIYEVVGSDVDYAFIEEEDTLYIYFKPSDSKIDWFINFAYWRRPYKDMDIDYRVHGGFLAVWKAVEDIVIAKIKDKRWKHVVISGYSHGAALAALCHECVWFHREDLRADGLETHAFDGPRVYAGFKVKKELEERWRTFYLYRNFNDIVTHMPPTLFGFTHVGTVIEIGAGEDPGLIKAHYYGSIRKSLVEYEKDRL
jgi:triacylglycerol lipase